MFDGFSENTLGFLKNLQTHNDRKWFDQNKQDYETSVLTPFRELVAELGKFMLTIDPDLEVRPAVNKTISGIYRDTRFSRNKSPFKTTMWLTFKRPNRDWKDAPAYFFEISASFYRYGMGLYSASPATMRHFRKTIDDQPRSFLNAIAFYNEQDVFVLAGEKYKKAMGEEHPTEIKDWYQRRNFYLVHKRQPDAHLFSRDLIDDLSAGFVLLAPFYHYLWRIRARTE